MDERCDHCGASMCGSDHCPCCGCEEHERTCDHVCPDPTAGAMTHMNDH